MGWLVGLALLSLVWGCAGRRGAPDPAGDADSSGANLETPRESEQVQEIIQSARGEVDRGESLLEEQDREGARDAFNRALDILLSVEGGAEENQEIKPVYAELVSRIHLLELEALGLQPEEGSLWYEELDAALELADLEVEETAAPPSPTDPTYDIPIDHNERVASIITMFQERRRDWFQEALRRSGLYIGYAQSVFREEGLPEDLVYLAMVESAFKTRAVSRANARGMWQFIYGTGRLYGLRQDYWVDDRFDPEKSTRAAARHLKDLYEDFGDWYLVMAAYNAGPNKVKRAIARTGSRDFWKLSRTRYLRRETKSYVPLILATIVIAKDPARYGFDTERDPPWQFDVVEIDSPVDLGTAAKCAGTSLSEMKELNPELRRWVTPVNRPQYSLRVPQGSQDAFRNAFDSIPPEERVRFVAYTVRRGDTLSQIAGRYRTSVNALVDANNIRRRSLIRPGQVLTVPVPAGTLARTESAPRTGAVDVAFSDGRVYVVQRGDTLSEIADGHGVALSRLRRWNGLEGRSRIYPGQKLVIRGGEDGNEGQRRVVYTVRRGDTLTRIAQRFGVRVDEIRRWNNRSHDRIIAGESLEIYTSSP